jgi:channel protein (hemolysin III family)
MANGLYPIPGFHDPFSSLTHLLAAPLFAILAIPLLRRGLGNGVRVASLAVFACSAVLLLSLSGVYHLLPDDTAGREVLRRLDNGAVFVLIAGTFTPAHAILFCGPERWLPLLVIWGAAATGITLRSVFGDLPEAVGLTFYLGLGWAGTISVAMIWQHYGLELIRPLFWGGLAYTAGAVLEFLRSPNLVPGVVGPHEVFHLLVLLGLGFHWWFVWKVAPGGLSSWRRWPEIEKERRGR